MASIPQQNRGIPISQFPQVMQVDSRKFLENFSADFDA